MKSRPLPNLHHRAVRAGRTLDAPDLAEDVRNLHTLPYVELMEVLADTIFPPNRVIDTRGRPRVLRASEARPDRYVLFRATWEPAFGIAAQLALRDLSDACGRRHGRAFVDLTDAEKRTLLEDLERGRVAPEHWPPPRGQSATFETIRLAITEGLLAEPGYGGNRNSIGWYYSNFMRMR